MDDDELTPEELELVHQYIELAPGLEPDRQDVMRANIANSTGGRYRKLAPGVYEIITGSRRFRS